MREVKDTDTGIITAEGFTLEVLITSIRERTL